MAKFTGVSAVEKSANAKIGNVSATYASQKTCPSSCPFYKSGCYAESGNTGFQTNRLNKAAAELDAQALAENEASAIRDLSGSLPLRLHVVGDCQTDSAAATVSAAAADYAAKHGQTVWTYTHAWRDVNRESWQEVSVLASTESIQDAKLAMLKGYAAAIVTSMHKDSKAYVENGVRVIPCPQQTGKSANCESCKLCWNADRLHASQSVIAFETHGSGSKKAAAALLNILQ